MLIFLEIFVDIGKELLRKVEFRKDWVLVHLETVDLLSHLEGVAEGLGMLVEDVQHFLLALEVLLLGIAHTVRIVKVCVCGEADESVVCRSVLLAHEVHVVRSHDLRSGLLRKREDALVHNHLVLVHLL